MQRATEPRRVVVTGGAGFLGAHVCERLVERGAEVVCIDSLATGSTDNLDGLLADDRFHFQEHDLVQPSEVSGPVDMVLHLACPASPRDYLRMPVETLRVGSLGTLNALDLARRTDARFVLASTSEVYGDPRQHPQTETYWGNVNPIGPRAVYDEAKRFSETATTAYRTTYGVDTGIVRIFNTYGPRMRIDDGRVVPTFIRQALAGEPLTVTGNGRQTRSLCYVDDTVAGILTLAYSRHTGPVNIGNPHEMTVLDLARLVLAITESGSEITFVDRPVDDPELRRPDTTLAAELLGWQPRTSPEEGLAHTVGWFAASSYREISS